MLDPMLHPVMQPVEAEEQAERDGAAEQGHAIMPERQLSSVKIMP
jgi:hypothetical protein